MRKHVLKSLLYSVLILMVSAGTGCQLAPEVFNEERFLVPFGLAQADAATQVRPDVDNLVQIKITNNTNYPVSLPIRVNRESGVMDLDFGIISSGVTIGKLIEDADEDKPGIVRLKILAEESDSTLTGVEVDNLLEQNPIPLAFVIVRGSPVFASSAPDPLELDEDFELGDTIEYIVQRIAGETAKFRVVAAVYRSENN